MRHTTSNHESQSRVVPSFLLFSTLILLVQSSQIIMTSLFLFSCTSTCSVVQCSYYSQEYLFSGPFAFSFFIFSSLFYHTSSSSSKIIIVVDKTTTNIVVKSGKRCSKLSIFCCYASCGPQEQMDSVHQEVFTAQFFTRSLLKKLLRLHRYRHHLSVLFPYYQQTLVWKI